MDGLTSGERAEADAILADLHKRGYVDRASFNELAPGVRVRSRGHQWIRALEDGTGYVVAITERPDSAWSLSWGMPDVEMVVVWDKPMLEDMSRLSRVAQYHVSKVPL